MRFTLVPGHKAYNIPIIFLSSLVGSLQPWAAVVLQRLFHTQYHPLPPQVPTYTPG